MISLIILSVAIFEGTYGALQLQPYNETALGMFIANDPNADGVITCVELEASFDKYDMNGDGTESRHEYTEYICAVSPSLYQLSHWLFDEYDFDGDHHLVKTDYDQLCAAMDTNGDSNVTPDEFIDYWVKVFPKYESVGQHGQHFAHGNSACH
ncbi:visinin-like protein 1 [Mya arenaria]|uniref:visinin-like protein 1 n=1 Tax=Mya arenaria TaxID=6604 RepID=UPI0022E110AA|nr:visinin-like protein 1 [Mya arenaria]XP_052782100.1 visinin-like protein 1 [Mya arenaria]